MKAQSIHITIKHVHTRTHKRGYILVRRVERERENNYFELNSR
jgi:hypothetical protein